MHTFLKYTFVYMHTKIDDLYTVDSPTAVKKVKSKHK